MRVTAIIVRSTPNVVPAAGLCYLKISWLGKLDIGSCTRLEIVAMKANTTAMIPITIRSERMLNRHDHLIHGTAAIVPENTTSNQYGTATW